MIYRHILFIHRDSRTLNQLNRTLENVGHKVVVAHNLNQALEVIESEHPQMIIVSDDLDAELGDICREIKNQDLNGVKLMVVGSGEATKEKMKATECGADEYMVASDTLPRLMERINELLYDEEAGKDLAGSIAQSGLIDVLQLLEFSAKSGVLTVNSGNREGNMAFSEGRLIDAHALEKDGEAAVYEMLSWKRGEFSFQAREVANDKPVLASISSLVLEWARASDEGGPTPTQAPPTVEEETEKEDDKIRNWASGINAWLGYLREK